MLGPNHTYKLCNAKTNKSPEQLLGYEKELNPEQLEPNQNPGNIPNEDKMDQTDVNTNQRRQENQTFRKMNSNNEDQVKYRKTNEVKRKKISAKRVIN